MRFILNNVNGSVALHQTRADPGSYTCEPGLENRTKVESTESKG